MGALDFLKNNKNKTARMLREKQVSGGSTVAVDFEDVLNGAQESVVTLLANDFGARMTSEDQKALRDILRERLDPARAHDMKEKARRDQRLAEIRSEMAAALSGFAEEFRPQGSGVDMAGLMAVLQQQQAAAEQRQQAFMTQMFAMMRPAAPAAVPPVPPTNVPPVPAPAVQAEPDFVVSVDDEI